MMKEKKCHKQLPLPLITEDESVEHDPSPGPADAVPSEPLTGALLIKEVFRTIEHSYDKSMYVRCVPTGITELDLFLGGGLQCSDLVTIAARPSTGKTSVIMSIAKHAAVEKEIPVLIFTPELTGHELMLQMLSSNSNVALRILKTGATKENDWCKLTVAASKLSYAPIFIDDTVNIPFQELRGKALKVNNLKNLCLIIVDGFQFMPPVTPRLSRNDELKDLIRSFKGLSKELDAPVLLTSYLDRKVDQRIDARPKLSDLTISGLDEFADLVLFLYRESLSVNKKDEADLRVLSVSVAKNRHGSLGTVEIMADDCIEGALMNAKELKLLH